MSLVLPSVQARGPESRDRHSDDACMYASRGCDVTRAVAVKEFPLR